MPYAIINTQTEQVVSRYGSIPPALQVGKKRVISPVAVGDEGLGHKLVELVEVSFVAPGPYYHKGEDISVLDGNTLTITRQWTAWTQQEITAFETSSKDNLALKLDDGSSVLKPFLLILLDELNLHSTKFQAVLDATAAATNLADFKTRMAAITAIPQRTAAQLRTAIRDKMDS